MKCRLTTFNILNFSMGLCDNVYGVMHNCAKINTQTHFTQFANKKCVRLFRERVTFEKFKNTQNT